MQAALLLRISSQLLSSIVGGMAVFCLYHAGHISDPDVVRYLFMEALKWGLLATAIVYCQRRYLDP